MQSRITNSRAQPTGCKHTHSLERVAEQSNDDILQPEGNSLRTRVAIGQDCGEKSHGVRTIRVADGFNVGVLVNIDAGADGYSLRHILGIARCACSDQRF